MGATARSGAGRRLWTRVVQATILLGGLSMLVVFWLTLLLSDDAISPIAFLDPPHSVLVTMTAIHVVTALASWIVATVSALAARRIGQILMAMLVVPITAVATLLVLMTDATVWRGDLGAWLGPMLMALAGPVALGVLLGWTSVGALRAARASIAAPGSAPPPPADAVPVDVGRATRPTERPAPAPKGRNRGVWIAGTAAGAVLVVLLAVRVVGGSSSAWEWVDDGRSLVVDRDAFAVAVTAGGPGFVAVGEIAVPTRQLIVWTSPDGRTWSRVPGDDAFGRTDERISVHDVVGTSGLVIAVGAVTSGTGDSGRTSPAVWISPDGHTWQRSWVGDETGVVRSVAAAGSTLVAVGNDGDAAAVWISTDATTWQRIDDPAFQPDLARVGDAPPPAMSLVAVTAGGPGFVAVGDNTRFEHPGLLNDADIRAVVFTSSDGATWTRVPHDATIFGGIERHRMTSVIRGGPGLVAVGYQPPRGPVAWTSGDGLTWQRHAIDDRDVRDVRLEDVTLFGASTRDAGTLVAVGQDWGPFTGSRRDVVAVLVSQDGVRWTRDGDRAFTTGRGHQVVLNGVAASDRGVVALGTVMGASWGGVDATVWFAPISHTDD